MLRKLHQQAHISKFLDYWGVLLSCYAPENRHRLMKRIMDFCFNKATATVMAYDVRIWLQNIQLDCTFEAYHLSGNIDSIDVRVDNMFLSSWSSWVQTPVGMFGKGDICSGLVTWVSPLASQSHQAPARVLPCSTV